MEGIIEKHMKFLVDRIDPDFGLLDKLLASGILTREALHKIKLKDNTTEDRNRILLDFILNNKKANEFVLALKDTGQQHLVNYLSTDGEYGNAFADAWPLCENTIKILDTNRESLVDLLDTSDLCVKLFSQGVINNRQRELICSKPTNSEKNEALLDMLTKCSLQQYKKTIDCVNDSNQRHIAELLLEGGAVVRIHANLGGTVGDVDELEEEIISKLTTVLENYPLEDAARLWELTKQRIIAARKGQSIVIYIHCATHTELQLLVDLLKADRMRKTVEMVFNELLLSGCRPTLKISLIWSLEEIKRAAAYFESEEKLYLTPHPERGEEKSSLRSPSVQVSDKFRSESKLNPKLVLKNRTKVPEQRNKWITGLLNPKLVQVISSSASEEGNKWITGLTILDDNLFVVSEKCSEVAVYVSMTFNFSRRWILTELTDPVDIASCKRNNCLYIFNYTDRSNEILRVDAAGTLIKRWSTGDDWGYGLSVTDDSNVILAVSHKNKLNEYSPDGRSIREIKLSSDLGIHSPCHAIKLVNGQYVVSYGFSDPQGVCIVDANGNLKKSFGREAGSEVNRPGYMCVDRNGFLMVADQWNSRVLLLDSDLRFQGEIVSNERHGLENPWRIVLDESIGRLFVIDNESDNQRIFIFNLK